MVLVQEEGKTISLLEPRLFEEVGALGILFF